ncbi:hypothetical protein FQN57_000425 [Myotisia sp. PD_48]|nr:hypothetical protein FQN57_000425 [Myotisia sp. PD_48]
MECLVRFAQAHQDFRKAEIEALATLAAVDLEFLVYHDYTPFSIIKVPDEAAARKFVQRSILTQNIYELWGQGTTYEELFNDIRARTSNRWPDYRLLSFRFNIDSYGSRRSAKEKKGIIESFAFLGFQGPIKMVGADEEFCVFEEYARNSDTSLGPRKLYFGRWFTAGSRDAIDSYDLKKRQYISTTSMDAELSLISANLAHAAPGKLFFDPFVGTGSFCVAMAHFGAIALGSDIDGRSFKGKDKEKGVPMGLLSNLRQYGLEAGFLDAFASDITNTPLRNIRLFDGIICDPPYGVREGLKVLGSRDENNKRIAMLDGAPIYTRDDFVHPKRPYSFEAMLDDILEFAARMLVSNGRISFWMPTANDDDVALEIPGNPHLELISVCIQPFNKWSRRLLTYRRLTEGETLTPSYSPKQTRDPPKSGTADDLNPFRRKYFQSTKLDSS